MNSSSEVTLSSDANLTTSCQDKLQEPPSLEDTEPGLNNVSGCSTTVTQENREDMQCGIVLQAGEMDRLPSVIDVQLIETTPNLLTFHDSTSPRQDASKETKDDLGIHLDQLCEEQTKDSRISQVMELSDVKTTLSSQKTISAITRKYKMRRLLVSKRHRNSMMKNHFVCEHCGLVSRCGMVLKRKVKLTSEKQVAVKQDIHENEMLDADLNHAPKDNTINEEDLKTFKSMENGEDVALIPVAEKNDEKGLSATADDEPKPYLCGKCSQGFVDVEPLVEHVAACSGGTRHINVVDEGQADLIIKTAKTFEQKKFDGDEVVGVRTTRSGRKVGYIVHKILPKTEKSDVKRKQIVGKKLQAGKDKAILKTRSGRKAGCLVVRDKDVKNDIQDGLEEWKPDMTDEIDENEMDKIPATRNKGQRPLIKEGQMSEVKGKRRGRRKLQVSNETLPLQTRSGCKVGYMVIGDQEVKNGGKDQFEDMELDCDENHGRKEEVGRKKINRKSLINPNNECTICHKTFSQKSSLYRHHSLVHKGVKKHECKTCHKRYQQKHNLTIHKCLGQRSPVSKSLLCTMCGKNFVNVSSLRHHERTLHIKSKQFSCPTCDRAFSSAGNMREHLKAVHNGRSYLCDLCGRSFSFKNSYNRHKRFHSGLKPYKCKHCERSFSSREGRQLHEMTHMVAEKVQCEYCGRRMKNMLCVAYHMKKHHSTEESRHFHCYRCEAKYDTNVDLARHMEECQKNQQICQYCCKTFSTKSNLSYHLRSHSEDGNEQKVQGYEGVNV